MDGPHPVGLVWPGARIEPGTDDDRRRDREPPDRLLLGAAHFRIRSVVRQVEWRVGSRRHRRARRVRTQSRPRRKTPAPERLARRDPGALSVRARRGRRSESLRQHRDPFAQSPLARRLRCGGNHRTGDPSDQPAASASPCPQFGHAECRGRGRCGGDRNTRGGRRGRPRRAYPDQGGASRPVSHALERRGVRTPDCLGSHHLGRHGKAFRASPRSSRSTRALRSPGSR